MRFICLKDVCHFSCDLEMPGDLAPPATHQITTGYILELARNYAQGSDSYPGSDMCGVVQWHWREQLGNHL